MATNSLVKLKERIANLQARHSNAVQRAKKGVHVIADTAVIGGTAGVFGVVQGRYGAKKIGPVPVDLATAVVAHAVGLTGPSRYAHQLHNIGHGAMAAYAVAVGRGFGKKMRAKAGEKPLLEGALDEAERIFADVDGGGMLPEDDLVAAARGRL